MIEVFNSKLVIIQGDTFYRQVTFEGVSIDKISGVYFSCAELGVCKKLLYNEEYQNWELELTSSETENLQEFSGTYDLTVEFFDKRITTVIYNGLLSVKEKQNKVKCYG